MVKIQVASNIDPEAYANARKKAARANMAIKYSMTSPVKALLTFKGSILPAVLKRPEFYFFTAIHIALVIVDNQVGDYDPHSGEGQRGLEYLAGGRVNLELYALPWSTIGILSGLLTFYLVFFNSQCYGRFNTFYTACTTIAGTLQEVAMQVSTEMEGEDRWDCVRYLLAAAILVYMKVEDDEHHKTGEPAVNEDEWDRLTKSELDWAGPQEKKRSASPPDRLSRQATMAKMKKPYNPPPLLTDEEEVILREYTGNGQLLLMMWGLRAMRKGLQKRGRQVEVYLMLEDSVLRLRRACAAITNMLAMPVPFPYFHALNLLMILVLAQYTYALVFLETYMSILILIFLLSMFLGMREVSAALSNPFGDDDVDLPVGKMIRDLRKLISPLVQETLESRLMPPHLAATIADDAVPAAAAAAAAARAPAADGAPTKGGAFAPASVQQLGALAAYTLPANAGGAHSSCPATPLGPAQTLPPLYVAATQAGPDGGIDGIHLRGPEYMKGLPLRQ